MKFANRHAAVTGGAGEIGLAIARRLSAEGAAVTLLDKMISPEVEKLGFRFVTTDVADPTSVAEAVSSLPPFDIAVANAGVHRGARALDLSPADWFLMLSVNTTGVFLFAQAAARRMVEAGGGGSIVVTGSWVQDVPNADNTGYCASKAAAAMVARCMALELGEHRIRVNVVAALSMRGWLGGRSRLIRRSPERPQRVSRSAHFRRLSRSQGPSRSYAQMKRRP